MTESPPAFFVKPFDFGGRQLDMALPHVMGVLNVTPDSFSDGGELMDGREVSLDKVLRRAQAMCEAGAAVLDVGGESTRPGAAPVSAQEEIDRVLPVVSALRREFDVIVSVDTSSPELMRHCASAGAGLINDVRALRAEGALEAAAASGLPVCLMHMLGAPATMQDNPVYDDIVLEVKGFLEERVASCEKAGINRGRITIDPGFGFGKTLAHNIALLEGLDDFAPLGLPLIAGLSRKRMIGALTGRQEKERLAGSIAAAVIAMMKGVSIIRVHDVAASVDAMKICRAVIAGHEKLQE